MLRYPVSLWAGREAPMRGSIAETSPCDGARVSALPTRREAKDSQCPLWDFFIASSCSGLAVP